MSARFSLRFLSFPFLPFPFLSSLSVEITSTFSFSGGDVAGARVEVGPGDPAMFGVRINLGLLFFCFFSLRFLFGFCCSGESSYHPPIPVHEVRPSSIILPLSHIHTKRTQKDLSKYSSPLNASGNDCQLQTRKASHAPIYLSLVRTMPWWTLE